MRKLYIKEKKKIIHLELMSELKDHIIEIQKETISFMLKQLIDAGITHPTWEVNYEYFRSHMNDLIQSLEKEINETL